MSDIIGSLKTQIRKKIIQSAKDVILKKNLLDLLVYTHIKLRFLSEHFFVLEDALR